MRLKRFLLRYYPPGIVLEYEQGGETKTKILDLLDLTKHTCTEDLVEEIYKDQPLITEMRKPQIYAFIEKLKWKLSIEDKRKFEPHKVLRAHILPLTNVIFNKTGSRFISASYDRTCKVWDTANGTEIHTLDGHKNVVYSIAFNTPFCDKIATGSFDKTARVWNAETGQCQHILQSHSAEVVCLHFNPSSSLLATGSMDTLAKLWDLETGRELASLSGHTAEVIALQFNQGDFIGTGYGSHCSSLGDTEAGYSGNTGLGHLMLTGSFDHTVCIWDVRNGERSHHLIGHAAEIAAAVFSFDSRLVATASMDKTVRLWDTRMGRQIQVLNGHEDEVLDVAFSPNGRLLASGSADGTANVWKVNGSGSTMPVEHLCRLEGHEAEVSKVCFNSRGTLLLTASADKTARVWDVQTGDLVDTLSGHKDEVFSCAFNYEGDVIITGSKDNTCRIWQ